MATRAKGMVFVTAQASRDAQTDTFVDGDFESQLRRSMNNLREVLIASGSDLEHLVNIKVFYLHEEDIPVMNKVLEEFLVNPPSRSSMAVAFLWREVRVMVECTAVTKQAAA